MELARRRCAGAGGRIETFHAGAEDDQEVGVVIAGGGEGVHGAGRNNDQVTLTHSVDPLAGEHLGGSGYDVEQLTGTGVMVGVAPAAPC